jgi:beta-galactosidase
MKKNLCGLATACYILLFSCQTQNKNNPTVQPIGPTSVVIDTQLLGVNVSKILIDSGWRFHLGGMKSAEMTDFNDSNWRNIDLPHDWSIENLKGTDSPFDSSAIGQVNSGFTVGGTGWYRKKLYVPITSKAKKVFVYFEGVYMNSDVYINGHPLGNHPYGYTSFQYDLTEHLIFGGDNILSVEVKNEGVNSRWYSGSGIYRHVWLQTTELVHLENLNTQVTVTDITKQSAGVNVKSSLQNESDQVISAIYSLRIINKLGVQVAKLETPHELQPKSTIHINENVLVSDPYYWSVDTPDLYTSIQEVFINKKLVGEELTIFGIRTTAFSVQKGFELNGQIVKLKGGCVHHDNGPLGAKAYDRAEERKVALLKKSGFNAVRCSHNPPSPSFLNACDRLGMLVIDEAFDCWTYGKNSYDYHLFFKEWGVSDIESIIKRDRNHPSIIMWSTGNEIPEAASPEGEKTSEMLNSVIRNLDTTRMITNAVCNFSTDKNKFFKTTDIAGYNYAIGGEYKGKKIYEDDHSRNPNRIMFGAESYPINAFENWMYVTDHSYLVGDFVWTAIDYIGEASIGWLGYPQSGSFYPWNLAFCGDIDICGFKRPQSYYRDALWMENQLSVFVESPVPTYAANPSLINWSTWNWFDVLPDWNWKGYENKPLNVSVYSSCGEVELLLNGKSLGRKPTNRTTQFKTSWLVPYTAGTLKAVGYKNNVQVNSSLLQTALPASVIKLTADRKEITANGQDLSYITVELCDANGIVNPKSNNEIKFTIQGEGTVEAVGNGDPRSTEGYTAKQRKAWKGKCLVVVKSTRKKGNIVLSAQVNNLPRQSITLTTK